MKFAGLNGKLFFDRHGEPSSEAESAAVVRAMEFTHEQGIDFIEIEFVDMDAPTFFEITNGQFNPGTDPLYFRVDAKGQIAMFRAKVHGYHYDPMERGRGSFVLRIQGGMTLAIASP